MPIGVWLDLHEDFRGLYARGRLTTEVAKAREVLALMRSGALLGVDLHKDTPDRLNAALVAGELDVGPISLVEYLRHADEHGQVNNLPHRETNSCRALNW